MKNNIFKRRPKIKKLVLCLAVYLIFPALFAGCNDAAVNDAPTPALPNTEQTSEQYTTGDDLLYQNGKRNDNMSDTSQPKPTLFQHFDSKNETVAAGWQISNWGPATEGNYMDEANVAFEPANDGDDSHGYLSLKTVGTNNLTDAQKKKYGSDGTATSSPSPYRNGGEIAIPAWNANLSQAGYGYGYYEVRMKPSGVGTASQSDPRGVCSSFFLQGGSGDTFMELDFEFLSNGLVEQNKPLENWMDSDDWGCVTLNWHFFGDDNRVDGSIYYKLDFNPSKEFRQYGFLWTKDYAAWYVDGAEVHRVNGPLPKTPGVRICMNNWTGDKWWGGNHPDDDAVSYYDWVRFYADADEPVLSEPTTE